MYWPIPGEDDEASKEEEASNTDSDVSSIMSLSTPPPPPLGPPPPPLGPSPPAPPRRAPGPCSLRGPAWWGWPPSPPPPASRFPDSPGSTTPPGCPPLSSSKPLSSDCTERIDESKGSAAAALVGVGEAWLDAGMTRRSSTDDVEGDDVTSCGGTDDDEWGSCVTGPSPCPWPDSWRFSCCGCSGWCGCSSLSSRSWSWSWWS